MVDNLFLGREPSVLFTGLIDRRRQSVECQVLLDRLHLPLAPHLAVRRLSMAQKQILEIGKALLQAPEILILDEPTASLTDQEVLRLFELLAELRGQGRGVLYVTHHLRDVLRIADNVSVMRDGRIVASQAITAATTEQQLIELLTTKRPPASSLPQSAARTASLRVRGLRSAACHGVDLQIAPAEIVGLYGVVGSGREEVGRALVGLVPKLQAQMELFGRPYWPRDPADALVKGVGFLPSDRKQDGICPPDQSGRT